MAEILVDDTHAVMAKADFDALLDYSCSMPTGVFPGKRWKRNDAVGKYGPYSRDYENPDWLMGEYEPHPTEPEKFCRRVFRKILVVSDG